MSEKKITPKKNFYPAMTPGSKAAKKLRSESNHLAENQRENLFQRGMQIIYGGSDAKKTVGVGR